MRFGKRNDWYENVSRVMVRRVAQLMRGRRKHEQCCGSGGAGWWG